MCMCVVNICGDIDSTSHFQPPPPLKQAQGTLSKIRDVKPTILGECRRPWVNIKTTLAQRFVFAELFCIYRHAIFAALYCHVDSQISLLHCFISISCLDFGGRVTYRSVVAQ